MSQDIRESIRNILEHLGEDSDREGLKDTPSRVVKSWEELYSGYKTDPKKMFTVFDADGYDQMVVLRDIEMYSTCEHHMLPFYGKAHIGYIPGTKIIGLSKLARVLDVYARRLQVQERIGQQVTQLLMDELNPIGAACIIEARHMCMCARGVNKQNSSMITSSLRGAFETDPTTRQEFLNFIK